MFKKKMAMGGLAVLAMTVVIGTGFAVWNFETSDDASKGIYNIGLYVTPKVDTVGTISTNNDYALILDQGENPSLGKDGTLATNKDYYKRGIYVGELEKDESSPSGFKTLPNGSYSYKQVSELSGFWIQTVDDAKAIVAESVNDMTFTTTIKLRKKAIARYVQVNLDDEYYVDSAASENDIYINYVYNWGNLSQVLTNDKGILKVNKGEFYKLAEQDSSANNQWLGDNVDWEDSADAINPLTDLKGELPKGVTEADIYNVAGSKSADQDGNIPPVGGDLTLRSHYALVTYMLFDTKRNVPLKFFGTDDAAQIVRRNEYGELNSLTDGQASPADCVVSIAYFMYYKTDAREDDLKNLSTFANEKANDDSSLTEVTSDENVEIGEQSFAVKECYYFKYTLDVSNYGEAGKDGDRQYENARFSYYPKTADESDGPADVNIDKTLEGILTKSYKDGYDGIPNGLDAYDSQIAGEHEEFVSKAYYKKPSKVEEYQNMLKIFKYMSGTPSADESSQFVQLGDRYVVVEFSSELITKASSGTGDPSIPGPSM